MNRKQRRTKASIARKALDPWLKQQIERINEQHREEIAYNRQQAEQALWTLLSHFQIKEAAGRWFYNSNPRRRSATNEIYLTPDQYASLRVLRSGK